MLYPNKAPLGPLFSANLFFLAIKRPLIVTLLGFLSIQGWAGVDVQKPLVIAVTSDAKLSKKILKSWRRNCSLLGRSLSSSGWAGVGKSPFTSSRCLPPQQSLKSLSLESYWLLEFSYRNGKKGPHIGKARLSLVNGSKRQQSFATKLPPNPHFLVELKDRALREAFAQHMLILAPFSTIATKMRISRNGVWLPLRMDREIPRSYLVLEPTFNGKSWRPGLLGKLTLGQQQKSKVFYNFEPFQHKLLSPQQTYVLHPTEAREVLVKRASDQLSKIIERKGILGWLNDQLEFFGLGSSYASVRYGAPLIQDTSILSKIAMVAANAEFRSGLLSGLRWYWDVAPEQRQISPTDPDIEESLTWSRVAFGWAFGLELPRFLQPISDKLDIIIKLGLLDFDGRFAAGSDDGFGRRVSFVAKNVVDFGLEFGIEKALGPITYRIMAASNWANASLSLTNSAINVFSYRGSFDIYIPIGLFFGYDLKLLAFGSGEAITLSRASSASGDASDLSEARGLEFNQGFLGLGFTLAW